MLLIQEEQRVYITKKLTAESAEKIVDLVFDYCKNNKAYRKGASVTELGNYIPVRKDFIRNCILGKEDIETFIYEVYALSDPNDLHFDKEQLVDIVMRYLEDNMDDLEWEEVKRETENDGDWDIL